MSKKEEKADAVWIQKSADGIYKDRIIWVVGSPETLQDKVRDLARSQNMVKRYGSRVQSIPPDKQRLFFEEQSRCEELEKQVKNAIAEQFIAGQIYFQGRTIDKHIYGTTFSVVLKALGESILPTLYEKYVEIAILPKEREQLLEPTISGASSKFMSDGLGIFELDAGKYNPSCKGDVPSRILQYLTDNNGSGGTNLLQYFGSPPFGYGSDIVQACIAGLLRAGKIQIQPESGSKITSVRDPGTKDIFSKDGQFKRANILLQSGQELSGRDRNKICKFFQDPPFNAELDRENDAIADAVFNYFPGRAKVLRELEDKYNQLPNRPELPDTLIKLRQALVDCTRSRQVEDTVIAVKKHLDTLRDGIEQLGIIHAELTEDKINAVRQANKVKEHHVKQLEEIGKAAEIEVEIQAIKEHLSLERPWRDVESLQPHLKTISDRYQETRLELIDYQEKQAQKIETEIKHRKGFGSLCEEKSSYVIEPLKKARCETTKESIYPRLLDLNNNHLDRVGQDAHHRLDKVLTEETQTPFFTLEISKIIANREIGNEQEVETFITELRERLLEQLKNNVRIRLT